MNWWHDDLRINIRRGGTPAAGGRCVVYWMQRAQRALDNPALEVAIRAANELGKPVVVFFALLTTHPVANLRHYTFMVEGLADTALRLERRGLGFVIRACAGPNPVREFLQFCAEMRAAVTVTDENPLRHSARWRELAAERIEVPLLSVDADVIVPTVVLQREQFAARTIRPRIHAVLGRYLKPVGNLQPTIAWKPRPGLHSLRPAPQALLDHVIVDASVKPVAERRGGTAQALLTLEEFLSHRLRGYSARRNHPECDGTSRLSAYLHFGHLGPHTVAMSVLGADPPAEDREAFLEELIVRRELAVNFVHYNPNYDCLEGCEPWALKSLRAHAHDVRERHYSLSQFERAETHDPLWNAAQRQMVLSGWMHGYLRMYWAKKILEWSRSPAEAFRIAVALNDRYEIDGRDPNGYTGIAWAIGGKHDRAWGPQRPVFGLIRFMSFQSTMRKFDSESYINRWSADPRPEPAPGDHHRAR